MKYLLMSTSPNITTGYGIISNNLMNGLKDKIDIKMLGLQNIGHQKEEWNLPVLEDIYGRDSLEFYVKLFKIDYLLTILDNWVSVYHYIPDLLKNLKCGHICHVTANSLPLPFVLYNQIKEASFLIAPSIFVQKTLLKHFPPEKIFYIPHGIDTKLFKPSAEIKEAYKKMLGYENKFVWLAVATNRGFDKNWQGLFYAYKIFLVMNPGAKKDTLLHCQTNLYYPEGYNLEFLAKMYGIEENIRFVSGFSLNAGMPQEEIVKLYNASDCFLSSSMGESFGLPALESMACGLPCIIPNHTTGPELVGEPKTGLLIELLKMKNEQEYGWTGPMISDKWLIDPVDMAEKMTQIYKSENLRKEFSENAVKFAQGYDWEKYVIPKWLEFFNHVESFREPADFKKGKLGI